MSDTLRIVLKGVLDRLQFQATTYLPSLIAAAIVILGAYLIAIIGRRVLYRIFKGTAIDRFMRQSGVAFMIDPSGRLRATRIVAETFYWSILIAGFLTGLSVFGTDLTAQIIQSFIFMIPKLVVAGFIILGGAWLSQYLARCTVVWAVNEYLPYPRRFSIAVRLIVMFVAVVVAADYLDFARNVFLASFIILVGGLVLTISLAVGLGASPGLRHYLKEREKTANESERSLWSHL
jgi:hypothetical protein